MVRWAEDEKKLIDSERNYGTKYVMTEDVHNVEVDVSVEPPIVKTKFGPCRVINLIKPEPKEGEKKPFFIYASDALFREYVNAVHDKVGRVSLKIVRRGLTQDNTKYTVTVNK